MRQFLYRLLLEPYCFISVMLSGKPLMAGLHTILSQLFCQWQSLAEEHKHDEDEAIEMEDLIGEVDEEMSFYDANNDGYM